MRDFLLDTQIIRYWHDSGCSQHEAVINNVLALRQATASLNVQPRLLISVITLGEIEFGHRDAPDPDPNAQAAYVRFIQDELPGTFELSADAATIYGELRSRLYRQYMPRDKRKRGMRPEELIDLATAKSLGIQENDLWLCSQAMAHGLVFVTNDRMTHIQQVAPCMTIPLLLQNWTQPGMAKVPE